MVIKFNEASDLKNLIYANAPKKPKISPTMALITKGCNALAVELLLFSDIMRLVLFNHALNGFVKFTTLFNLRLNLALSDGFVLVR